MRLHGGVPLPVHLCPDEGDQRDAPPQRFLLQSICTECHQYIQFNYSHDISIDDVAKSVGVSRSHLYRVFMLNVGKSPIDYLTEYRINEACKLLRAGNLSIAEVAISVGFFDQFYFSRVFKRAKGCRPANTLPPRAKMQMPPLRKKPDPIPFQRRISMPLQKNQVLTLTIERLSNDGSGVAHSPDGEAAVHSPAPPPVTLPPSAS